MKRFTSKIKVVQVEHNQFLLSLLKKLGAIGQLAKDLLAVNRECDSEYFRFE